MSRKSNTARSSTTVETPPSRPESEHSQTCNPGMAILNFCVDGLAVSDRMFVTKCEKFLRSNGPNAIKWLMQRANASTTKPIVKTRLLRIVKLLQTEPLDEYDQTPQRLALDALIDGLRVQTTSIHAKVREIFRLPVLSDEILGDLLLTEAITQKRKPAYSVRLIETAGAVVGFPNMDHWSQLLYLSRRRKGRVRAAAQRLLSAFMPLAEETAMP